MTYEDISSKSGVPISTLNAYVKKKIESPKEETLIRIASAFGDSPDAIFTIRESARRMEQEASAAANASKDKEVLERFIDAIKPVIAQLLEASRVDSDARYNRRLEKVSKQYADLYGKQEQQYHRSVTYLQVLVRNVSFALIVVAFMSIILNVITGAYALYAYITFDVPDATRGIYQGDHLHNSIIILFVAVFFVAAVAAVYAALRVIRVKLPAQDKEE